MKNIYKCLNCGAPIKEKITSGKISCPYCGSSIDLDANKTTEEKIRLKEFETYEKLRKQEIELEKQENVYSIKAKKGKIIASLIIGVIGLLMIIVGYFAGYETGDGDSPFYMVAILGMIIITIPVYIMFSGNNKKKKNIQRIISPDYAMINDEMLFFEDENYILIKSKFEAAGFTNIKCVPLNDLNFFTKKNNGKVENISVNGSEEFEEGDTFVKDSPVIISYHSYK